MLMETSTFVTSCPYVLVRRATVVIEELLVGPEVSVFALSDGKHIECMLPAQDHKRLLDGDLGPNTGGMGAYTPTPLATPADLAAIKKQIAQRTVDGFAADGHPYQGLLYCQVMLTASGKLLFSCPVHALRPPHRAV